jgi:hypothetical protein
LPKGVAYLPRYAVVSAAANHRYLEALAVVDDPAAAYRALDRLTQPARDTHGRASRAFNPATVPDLALFAAVLRGEHMLHGFRNRHVRLQLFGATATTDRRRSAQVSRLVKRLHLRGLVAKMPRSRRWPRKRSREEGIEEGCRAVERVAQSLAVLNAHAS